MIVALGGLMTASFTPLGGLAADGDVGTGPSASLAAGDESSSDAAESCGSACVGAGLQLPGSRDGLGVMATPTFSIISPGFVGAEPTLGVTPDGQEVYIQYGVTTARSTDGGATWDEIAPAYMNVASLDPMLYYDAVLDRLYVQHLTIECTLLAWTDNPSGVGTGLATGAAEWFFNPHACGAPGIDHPKLDGGPSPMLGAANGGRTVYMAYSEAGAGAVVAKSVDGGFTWVNRIATHSLARGTVLWPTGPVTADPAGTYVYLPHHNPSAGLMVAFSSDEGVTWRTRTVSSGAGASGHAVDPEVAVDASGTAYVVWYSDVDHQVRYAYSTDHGDTWSSPAVVSDSSVTKSTVFPAVVANDTGKFAVAYYGTEDSSAGPDDCVASGSSKCVWYVYLAHVADGDTSSPTITRTQVTPDSDPVQVGKICTEGTDCASGTRNLLDFIDIKADAGGTLHVVYTDGCVGSCDASTTGQTTGESGRYARQTGGSTI